jgi:transcriptional regulator with XRE-family HTH domain/quercetin dioxygenase-like cupin family protein
MVASSPVPRIGARLRAERRRRGLTVRGLAREIGVSASLISQIETEKSRPSVSTLYAITTALAISIEDLFAEPAADLEGPEEDDEPAEDDGQLREAHPGRRLVPAAPLDAALAAAVRTGLASPSAPGALEPAVAGPGPEAALGPDGGGPAAPRLGPVVRPDQREVLTLDSGVTWELLGRIPHKHVDFLLITYQPGGTSSSSGLLMRHSGTEFGFVLSGELVLTLGFQAYRLAAGDAVSFDSSNPHGYRNESTEPAVGVWFVLERST